jgi:hypothetical protein
MRTEQSVVNKHDQVYCFLVHHASEVIQFISIRDKRGLAALASIIDQKRQRFTTHVTGDALSVPRRLSAINGHYISSFCLSLANAPKWKSGRRISYSGQKKKRVTL